MSLKELLEAFIRFRAEVLTRRTRFELNHARDRAHVLVGLAIAVANIDEVIEMIRRSPDPNVARERLMAKDWPAADVKPLIDLIAEPGREVSAEGTYRLSEVQARAILELRLQRLTGLERDKIAEELTEVAKLIEGYLELLGDRDKLFALMAKELVEIKEKYATPRRTEIVDNEFEQDIEDLIQREDMVVTVTHGGYVKRVPVSAYRAQRRGARAARAWPRVRTISSRAVRRQHAYARAVLLEPRHRLQTQGLAVAARRPAGARQGLREPAAAQRGRDHQHGHADAGGRVELVEAQRDVRDRTRRRAAQRARRLREREPERQDRHEVRGEDAGDRLIGVAVCTEDQDVLLATRQGRAMRFPTDKVRLFASRNSTGVRGIALAEGDEVISMSLVDAGKGVTSEERDAYLRQSRALRQAENAAAGETSAEAVEEETPSGEEAAVPPAVLSPERFAELQAREEFVLTVASSGFGKRTSAYEYRVTGRGGKGVELMSLAKGGEIVAALPVLDTDEIMLVTDGGTLIRCPVDGIRIAGRATRGVRIVTVSEGERVVTAVRIGEDDPGNGGNGDSQPESETGTEQDSSSETNGG